MHDIDDLLVKYLTGEATAAETSIIQQWLEAGEANRKYFDHFRLIWEESLRLAATTEVDEQQAWERFVQRTQEAPPPRGTLLSFRTGWLRIAAIFIVVAGLGWLAGSLLLQQHDAALNTLVAATAPRTDTLPDGSVITLNKHSRLTVPAAFTGDRRKVELAGEGFFNVKADKEHPFEVHTDNKVIVEVVGTSFNIKNGTGFTEVIVETGVVRVRRQDQTITLQAGEKVMIHPGEGILQKEEVTDRLYNYYRSRVFECDSTPLWKLVDALNEAYQANIVIGRESLRNESISATFHNESLDDILTIVSETMAIDVIRENNKIILR
jgi:transmembrane sensor